MTDGRENTSSGLSHPTFLDGRQIWLDPEVEDIVHRLNYGDSTLGWPGDPSLALYRTQDDRWELVRLESDGEYRTFCRSKPGAKLDNRLIIELVAHDTRKGYNVHDAISQANARLEAERDKKLEEETNEKLQKVYWALGKDIGHLY